MLLLVIGLLVGGEARASSVKPPPNARNPYIPAIINLYESFNYEAALSKVQEALKVPGNSDEESSWLYLMQGVLLVDVEKEAEVVDAFKHGLALKPDAQLPVKGSQAVRKRFDQARNELTSTRAPPRPAAVVVAPAPPAVSSPPRVEAPREAPPAAAPVTRPVEAHRSAAPPLESSRAASTPLVDRVHLPTIPPPNPLVLEVAVQTDADALNGGLSPGITGMLLYRLPANRRLSTGGSLTIMAQPRPGVRAEGRLEWSVLPAVGLYATAGATAFLPTIGLRGGLGVGVVTLGQLHLFADVAYEKYINPGPPFASNAVLLSLGAGWRL